MSNPSNDSWSRISNSSGYKALLRSKNAFILPASFFFVVYYFSLLVLVGWIPEIMKKPVLGPINWAYLFALSQFFMAWVMAFVYVRKAAEWDRQAKALLEEQSAFNKSSH